MKLILLTLLISLLAVGQQTQASRIVICTDAGSTDTYACTPTPAVTSYTTGLRVRMYANTVNTGAATVNISTLGAKTIVKVGGGITTALADADIRAGQYVELIYDGTNFQMMSQLGNAPSGGSAGTINSGGAGQGYFWPRGAPSYSSGGIAVSAGGANRGYKYQFVMPWQLESRYAAFNITTGGAGGTYVGVAIYTADLTSIVASAYLAVGASTGNVKVAWSGGSAVTGGVLTLAPGVYHICYVSDSTAIALSSYGINIHTSILSANTTIGGSLTQVYDGFSATAISTGSGGSLVFTGNISGVSWATASSTNVVVTALLN